MSLILLPILEANPPFLEGSEVTTSTNKVLDIAGLCSSGHDRCSIHLQRGWATDRQNAHSVKVAARLLAAASSGDAHPGTCAFNIRDLVLDIESTDFIPNGIRVRELLTDAGAQSDTEPAGNIQDSLPDISESLGSSRRQITFHIKNTTAPPLQNKTCIKHNSVPWKSGQTRPARQ